MRQGAYQLNKLFPVNLENYLTKEIERLYFQAESDSENIHTCLQKLDFSGQKKLLDVGCGPGSTASVAYNFNREGHITGYDREIEFINYANNFSESKKRTNVKFIQNNQGCEKLPFENESFDICFSRFLFEHLANPYLAFNELMRVTKKGGKIGIYENDSGLTFLHPEPRHHQALQNAENYLRRFTGGDGFMGRKLFYIFTTNNMKNVKQVNLFRDNNYPGKEDLKRLILWYGFPDESAPLVKLKLMKLQDLQEYTQDLKRFCEDKTSYISLGGCFVWGEKI